MRRAFWIAFGATLAWRAWFAAVVPVTADEAYFALWGREPAAGYYDHPPMIGWWLALLVPLSGSAGGLRLPALALPPLLALGVRALLARLGAGALRADLAGLVVLLLPLHVWNVFVTTDVPLALFTFASLALFALALRAGSQAGAWGAGVLLGCAFLSKYFALLTGIAMAAWALATGRARAALWLFVGALPAALWNLAWNLDACGANLLFNLVVRHDEAGLSLAGPALYAASVAYLAAPLFWAALRADKNAPQGAMPRGLFLAAWLVPFLAFAALSPVRRVGLHWFASFLPALALWCALRAPAARLAVAARVLALFALAHAALGVALAAQPLERWRGLPVYARLVFLAHAGEIGRAAVPAPDWILAADSYSAAALLEYHTRLRVPVYGGGSTHARHDDFRTDWRAYDGRDLAIVRRVAPELDDYRPYFRTVELRRIELAGATFYVVLGRGFDYRRYRDTVLVGVRERYYRFPAWLPVRRCPVLERYDL